MPISFKLIDWINNILDSGEKDRKIAELEEKLAIAESRPVFKEVSKEIDLTEVLKEIHRKVEEEFKKTVKLSLLDAVSQAAKLDRNYMKAYATLAVDESVLRSVKVEVKAWSIGGQFSTYIG